ncbi:glycerol-3-phosphate 1-O-acyltransferase PlsB [Arenimonas terrae]|uniref:Glycerol-3-phosphate acyltransferase n=1 Tax=Arenimonas terrae TaxID=2546226 RepID=A0A5C4RNP4_9GAMM|nr:glycerol-3-phosphate 1-O-acyltransferase PlsB [Arenimonas terrae]TNJ32742.1 glycerol-3-phosphate 1-O-acyltransferase PlsB [Arenimonas terrae]
MDDAATPPPAPRLPSKKNRPPLWARFIEKLLQPWIEIKREPVVPPFNLDRPVCYVIENYGLSNALILDRACREAGLPSPLAALPGDPLGRKRAYVALSRRRAGLIGRPKNRNHSDALSRLLMAHRLYPDQDVQLVPVSIFVGRAPTRQSGWFSVLFSENWALVGRFRRLLAILLNGRDTLVQFSPGVRVWEILGEDLPHERQVRKVSRVLRGHFRRIKTAVIGPDLSTRRLLVDRVLDAEPVRKAITDQARRDSTEYLEAWKKAHGFAWEIAADYSNPVVRSASFALTGFWNRIYGGVDVNHLDALKQVAPGHEVIYVPSHRSHMDYLLLSYLLYSRGIVPPHIVAGINLNMPVIGPILRRGGAFFIRRSIKGNALYAAVLGEYVAQLVGEGFSLEYFIEGGRSRTGRLLAPKGGMIVMTIKAFLRAPRRPVVFQPVYIGYEKLIEGKSYLDELTGQPKEKETIWALIKAGAGILRQHYGKVAVNFGEPIFLDKVLEKHAPDWRERNADPDDKPTWINPAVEDIAQQIQVNINRAADVNPVNLLALALLSTPKHAMSEADLLAQLALSKKLLAALPYSDRVTVTPMEPAEIVAYGEKIGVLTRTVHPLGDVISVEGETAVLQSYFRNNVLHLFAAASWVALCFQNNRRMSRAGLLRLGRTIYPFVQEELFLPWDQDGFADRLGATVDLFVAEGLLSVASDEEGGIISRGPGQTDEVYRLRAISHSLQQAFERYFIAITTLVKNGPRTLSSGELETLCQLTAQRLSLLYAPAAPEFFDKSLFRGFIMKLREMKLVWICPDGKLDFDEQLTTWEKDAKVVLGRELRHTIAKLSPEAMSRMTGSQPAMRAGAAPAREAAKD